MKRLWWNILIYSVLFVVVLFLVLNDYSPVLIAGFTFMAILIALQFNSIIRRFWTSEWTVWNLFTQPKK